MVQNIGLSTSWPSQCCSAKRDKAPRRCRGRIDRSSISQKEHGHSLSRAAMATSVIEDIQPDIALEKRPNRSVHLLQQSLRTLIYVSYACLYFLLATVWTILITFSVMPIVCIKRGYRQVPEYYWPLFTAQSELWHSYRASMHQNRISYDFEKGKPLPIGLQRRAFRSSEGTHLTQRQSSPLLKLPAEIRLQIYKSVILGDGPCVRISTHQKRSSRGKHYAIKFRGQWGDETLADIIAANRIPHEDCNCWLPRLSAAFWVAPCNVASAQNLGRGPLALSKSCRQVYLETIDLLYSE